MDSGSQSEAGVQSLYDRDFAAWALDQAARLRQAGDGGGSGPDWENLAEEVESLARSDRRAVQSAIRTVAIHLMKPEASPATAPRAGWKDSVRSARREMETLLGESPSLRGAVPAQIAHELPWARNHVTAVRADHGQTPRVPIASLSYTPEQIACDWWPA